MKNFLRAFCVIIFFLLSNYSCEVLVNPEANMVVSQDGNDIKSVIGIFDFGKVETGKSSTAIFKIHNTGKKMLHLTGSPSIEVQGHQYIHFDVVTMPMTSVKRKDWTTFQIKFRPSESQFYAATISIKSNDPDRNPYTFAVKGRGIIVDINVRQNANHIANDTGFFDFGTIYLGNIGQPYVFTIDNIGSAVLNLTGSSKLIAIEGADSDEFEIDEDSTSSTLNPGESTTFTITFKPVKVGNKTCKIVIANTDPDENPYNFTIKGSCIDPEIQVLDPEMNDIQNNTGVYDFGTNYQDNKILRTFTIKNLGTTDLLMNHVPIIRIAHVSAHAFSIEKQPASTVSPGSKATFVIGFRPHDAMLYSATVSILSNDEDENPFTFKILATGYIPDFDFNGDGINDLIVGAYNDDTKGEDTGVAYLYFGRSNYPADLVCTEADVIFTSSEDIVGFGYSVANAGDVNNDGFDDVLIGTDGLSSPLEDTGNAYLFLGRSDPSSEISIKNANVVFNGFGEYDCFDSALSSAGDFNGDGFDDIMLGAYANKDLGFEHGAVFIFFGRTSFPAKLDSSIADVTLCDEKVEDFGRILSYAGDFNNDGFDDVIVSAFAKSIVYVFLGKSNPPNIIMSSDADVIISSDRENGYFGLNVSSAGDFNNDGYSDIIIYDSYRDYNTKLNYDKVIVVFGSQYPPESISANEADVIIECEETDRAFGYGCNYAGDVNNDGISDIIIGDIGTQSSTNRAYIYYGSFSPQNRLKNTDADFIVSDIQAGSGGTNWIVTGCVGDFNNDQIDDVFISQSVYDDYGKVYVIYGKSNLSSTMSSSDADLIIYDPEYDTKLGHSIAGGK